MVVMTVDADAPVAVKERLEVFAGEVLAEAMNRPVQRVNGSLYLRGLLEQGPRKSLEPMVKRLAGDADYQSMQQFVADSPWEAALVVEAVAERVAGEIDVQAWVLDDTGFPKDGKDSPGVKRQYSGTLGKTGNCQIGVSVHAVGARGTVPLGWALYLPEDWCADEQRRRKAKIPDEVAFKTKPQLGVELLERAAGWDVPKAPVLGDHAYGENTWLRDRLHEAAGCEYVLSIGPTTKVFAQGTVFAVPPKKPTATRGPVRPRPDRRPEPIGELIGRLGEDATQMITFRNDSEGEPVISRFVFARVHAAHGWRDDQRWTGWREDSEVPPREEWLIAEWPEGHDRPTDYWISNLPADTEPEQLARLAHMRWKVELDYKQLKGELGLDHYEGRSYLGWYHHTALVSAAHGFLTLERHTLFTRGRPDTPEGRAAIAADLQVLDRPLPNLPTGNRSRTAIAPTHQTRRANPTKHYYVSGIERGVRNPTWQKVCLLASALDISVADVVGHAESAARVREGLERVLAQEQARQAVHQSVP